MNFLTTFSAIHNVMRYFVFITTILVVIQSLMGIIKKNEFTVANRKMAMYMMISCDMQLLIGLAVYYLNGHLQMIKEGTAMSGYYNRFYSLEHPVAMVLGIVLVHIAYSNAKKAIPSTKKFKRLFWFSFIALFLFLAQTPWPGKKEVGKPLFPGMASVR
jgi:hypothetical protein